MWLTRITWSSTGFGYTWAQIYMVIGHNGSDCIKFPAVQVSHKLDTSLEITMCSYRNLFPVWHQEESMVKLNEATTEISTDVLARLIFTAEALMFGCNVCHFYWCPGPIYKLFWSHDLHQKTLVQGRRLYCTGRVNIKAVLTDLSPGVKTGCVGLSNVVLSQYYFPNDESVNGYWMSSEVIPLGRLHNAVSSDRCVVERGAQILNHCNESCHCTTPDYE